MEEKEGFRRWDEMILDVLGLIFRKLHFQDKLNAVVIVCRSWSAISLPYYSEEIVIHGRYSPQKLQMPIHQSFGYLRRLRVSCIDDDGFFCVANNAGSLQSLELPRSWVSDYDVELVAPKFSKLTFLDLNFGGNMGARAMEAFGKNCVSLLCLSRRMSNARVYGLPMDDEVRAIAAWMPKLRHIEIAGTALTEVAVLELISCCKDLESMNISRWERVNRDHKILREDIPRLTIIDPCEVDCGEYGFSGVDAVDAYPWYLTWNSRRFSYDEDDDYGKRRLQQRSQCIRRVWCDD